jgi:hypothetical protein
MAIRLRGRITKTGLPYWAFVLDDARDAIRDQLEARKRQGESIDDESLILAISRSRAMKSPHVLGDRVGLNNKTIDLREFSTKLWRKKFNPFWSETSIVSTRIVRACCHKRSREVAMHGLASAWISTGIEVTPPVLHFSTIIGVRNSCCVRRGPLNVRCAERELQNGLQ